MLCTTHANCHPKSNATFLLVGHALLSYCTRHLLTNGICESSVVQPKKLHAIIAAKVCVYEVQRKEHHICMWVHRIGEDAACPGRRYVFVGQGYRQGVATPTWADVEFR